MSYGNSAHRRALNTLLFPARDGAADRLDHLQVTQAFRARRHLRRFPITTRMSLTHKFVYQRFEPSGYTRNPNIRTAFPITDYVFRWLGCEFIRG